MHPTKNIQQFIDHCQDVIQCLGGFLFQQPIPERLSLNIAHRKIRCIVLLEHIKDPDHTGYGA